MLIFMVKTKFPAGLRKEHLNMKIDNYQIQINGWAKPRFFSVYQDRVFFHVSGCPANSPCETCQFRIKFIRERLRDYDILFEETVGESGYMFFDFQLPTDPEISFGDAVEFIQVLVSDRVRVLEKWETEVSG